MMGLKMENIEKIKRKFKHDVNIATKKVRELRERVNKDPLFTKQLERYEKFCSQYLNKTQIN